MTSFDMKDIEVAENRLFEVATVTPMKAPELMSVFLRACFTLGHHFRDLHLLHRLAEKAANDRKAIIVVDTMGATLKEKGLASNDTSRQAIIDTDPTYSRLVEDEITLDSTLRYIDRKLRDMEAALGAVKRILDASGAVFWRSNPNLSTGGMADDIPDHLIPGLSNPTPQPVTQQGPVKLGKAVYR